MPASYQSSMAFPASRDDVFQAFMQAIPQCGFRVVGSDQPTGQISARARMGLRSWGENIAVTVSDGGKVDIKSSCRGIQLIDYGKNKANVNALFSAVGAALSSPPPQ